MNVTDRTTGAQSKLELVAEFLHHAPVSSELGPCSITTTSPPARPALTRAEVRDAIDVDGLLKAGYSRERLIELATQNGAGFDRRMFADALRRVQRYSDKQCAAYGLDAQTATALRQQFHDWQRQLTQAGPDQHPS